MPGTIQNDLIRFGNVDIPYTIRRSQNRKTIGITVCGPWVNVIAPSGLRAAAIRPQIEKKGEWILQKLDLARHHAAIYPKVLQAGDSIRFFGRQHLLRIHFAEIKRPYLAVDGRQFQLHLGLGAPAETGHALFKAHFRKALESRIPCWIAEYSAKLRVEPPPFRVRELGNRWGSCTPSGALQFHWLLAIQTPGFIRQVVAHEICHLIEPSHTKNFFSLMEKIHPQQSTRQGG